MPFRREIATRSAGDGVASLLLPAPFCFTPAHGNINQMPCHDVHGKPLIFTSWVKTVIFLISLMNTLI